MGKRLSVIIVLFFCSYGVFGQVTKFRTQQFAFKYYQENAGWTDWSEWEETSLLITYNSNTLRITIHEDPVRTFDIVASEVDTNEVGDKILRMNCIGDNEDEVLFKMVYDLNYNMQFYINYGKAVIVYNVIALD